MYLFLSLSFMVAICCSYRQSCDYRVLNSYFFYSGQKKQAKFQYKKKYELKSKRELLFFSSGKYNTFLAVILVVPIGRTELYHKNLKKKRKKIQFWLLGWRRFHSISIRAKKKLRKIINK